MKHKKMKRSLLIMLALIIFSCKKETVQLHEVVDPIVINKAIAFKSNDTLNVSREMALTFARNFGQSKLLNKRSGVEVSEIILIPDLNNEPALYVFQYIGGGYLILSATKKESPVLGFSNKSFDLDNVPQGLAHWFFQRMDRIQVIRNDSTYNVPQSILAEWEAVSDSPQQKKLNITTKVISTRGPLLSTTWGQQTPFNNKTPLMCGSHRPPIGCVATATGQIARYYSVNKRATKYNWDIMPENQWTGRTYDGDAEVSRLMINIANLVDMNFDCDGSGASTGKAKKVFEDHLGYFSGGRFTYGMEHLETTVKNEILKNRPVIMSGCAEHETYEYTVEWLFFKKTYTGNRYDRCHAWVCDGVQVIEATIRNFGPFGIIKARNDFFHMNWGWSGFGQGSDDNNGWFRFDDTQINEGTEYRYKRDAFIEISPYSVDL